MGVLPRFPPVALVVMVALLQRRGWRESAALPAALTAVRAAPGRQPAAQHEPGRQSRSLPLRRLAAAARAAVAAGARSLAPRGSHAARRRSPCRRRHGVDARSPSCRRDPRATAIRRRSRRGCGRGIRHGRSPRAEAFAERTSHREPAIVPTATPGCEKVLLFEGRWPVTARPRRRRRRQPCRSPAPTATPTATTEEPACRGSSRCVGPLPQFPLPSCSDRTWPGRPERHAWVAARVGRARAVKARSLSRTCARCSGSPGAGVDDRGSEALVVYVRDAGPGARTRPQACRPCAHHHVDAGRTDVRDARDTTARRRPMVALPRRDARAGGGAQRRRAPPEGALRRSRVT